MENRAEPSRAALDSLDALHNADPATLNDAVRRLRRIVDFRRALINTILAPFWHLTRIAGKYSVPLVEMVAGVTLIIVLFNPDVALWIKVVLAYAAVGAGVYFVLSIVMAGALDKAAASVDVDSDEVLRRWADQSR